MTTNPLTPELIVDRVLPFDLQVAPTGRHVAWVALPASRRGEHPVSSIWLATIDPATGAPTELARRFTTGQAEDRHPRWAPDGQSLYFLSNRLDHDVAHLYRLAIDGGEAEPLTHDQPGLGSFAVAPNGQTIAYSQA